MILRDIIGTVNRHTLAGQVYRLTEKFGGQRRGASAGQAYRLPEESGGAQQQAGAEQSKEPAYAARCPRYRQDPLLDGRHAHLFQKLGFHLEKPV